MRLIDADALKPYTWLPADRGSSWLVINAKDVDNAPTIDPVKHGRWIDDGDMYGEYFTCSCCQEPLVIFDVSKFYFCPNCGAKMELKK